MKRLSFLALFISLSFWAQAQTYRVTMNTTQGVIKFYLYDNTPKHRDNMVKLIKQKFYDSLLFHRVIPEFMIQGGDPNSKNATAGKALGDGDVGYKVDNEINTTNFHKRGVIAAARDNNPEKSSSGCQFYIAVGKKYDEAALEQAAKRSGRTYTAEQIKIYKEVGGIPFLDGNYTVYGEVTEGMDVVEKIIAQPRNGLDRPNANQYILSATVKKKKKFLFF